MRQLLEYAPVEIMEYQTLQTRVRLGSRFYGDIQWKNTGLTQGTTVLAFFLIGDYNASTGEFYPITFTYGGKTWLYGSAIPTTAPALDSTVTTTCNCFAALDSGLTNYVFDCFVGIGKTKASFQALVIDPSTGSISTVDLNSTTPALPVIAISYDDFANPAKLETYALSAFENRLYFVVGATIVGFTIRT